MHRLHERPLSALDAIYSRRSVRSYTNQKLDESTIRSLLDAAVRAPTALQTEPWAFVVVQDPVLLKRYSDRAKASWAQDRAHRDLHIVEDASSCIFYDASTLIVICGKPQGPWVVADCWLAAENLMLAACALGLGTCCIGAAIPALNLPETKEELRIPADVTAVAAIIVGVPSGPIQPIERKDPEILSWH